MLRKAPKQIASCVPYGLRSEQVACSRQRHPIRREYRSCRRWLLAAWLPAGKQTPATNARPRLAPMPYRASYRSRSTVNVSVLVLAGDTYDDPKSCAISADGLAVTSQASLAFVCCESNLHSEVRHDCNSSSWGKENLLLETIKGTPFAKSKIRAMRD